MNPIWVCRTCQKNLSLVKSSRRRWLSAAAYLAKQAIAQSGMNHAQNVERIRNIGIIAHIDAGKTTTTERMLYYSGFTPRIGNVDDGSTITDFLPAERERGITIQSAAITFKWPPNNPESQETDSNQHTINLIDTPGHADFTFEVIRSLRILDGAVCILDSVAGVEAQTEKVWLQANNYNIPRIIYINKLDRVGAAFNRTVKEIASRLHTFPVLCQIPWWRNGDFIGVGDLIGLQALEWEQASDGSRYQITPWQDLGNIDPNFQAEMAKARSALVEILTEYDEEMVESFLEAEDDVLAISPSTIWQSLRKCLLQQGQMITPVFVGASFRNIGVQPLLDAVNALLPSPVETPDPEVSLGKNMVGLNALLSQKPLEESNLNMSSDLTSPKSTIALRKLSACALAFKVINDSKRGVLVYIRVYQGTINRNSLLYNTNLHEAERAVRLYRMYASDPLEIENVSAGDIAVVGGLKLARTGDTLVVYTGGGSKSQPPPPIDLMQLRPINVPPPLFLVSVEPRSASEEKHMSESLALLLREDPSLHVAQDTESGQTHLSGMGELHLEIASDRLLKDFKVRAAMGKIEIGYREALTDASEECTKSVSRDAGGKQVQASCTASISPRHDMDTSSSAVEEDEHTQVFQLMDSNRLIIRHPTIRPNGKPIGDNAALPPNLSIQTLVRAYQAGAAAALARGPAYFLPIHSADITITLDPAQHFSSTTDGATVAAAAREAIREALKSAARNSDTVLMEPVMMATIAVTEESVGSVVHDINAARGGQVLSLDADESDDTTSSPYLSAVSVERLSNEQLNKVYAPPDPYGDADLGEPSRQVGGSQPRQIRARVPLKEMVGYLKHLRSLTGGRGTFIMSVDRYERMSAQRMRNALAGFNSSWD